MQVERYQFGEYEDLAVEVPFAVSSEIIKLTDKLEGLKGGAQIQALLLEFSLNVAMSGGDFAAASFDKCAKLITELTMSLDGELIYNAISGDDLADLMRQNRPFGNKHFAFVSPTAPPADAGNADFVMTLVLLGPDCQYEGGARNHSWPSDLLRRLQLQVTTGAASLVDANATFTGTVRVRALGKKGGDMILAPLPRLRKDDAIDKTVECSEPGYTIRNMYAVNSSGFSDATTEQDEITIDDKLLWPPGHTLGEILSKQDLRDQILGGNALTTGASTGAQTGVTATTYPRTRYLEYVAGVGDLGDSPVHAAKSVKLKVNSSSTRNLRRWQYKHIDKMWIERVSKLIGKPIGVVEKIGFGPGVFGGGEDLNALGTVLPVRIGRHGQ